MPAKPQFRDIRGAYTDSFLKTRWIDMASKLENLPSGEVNGIPPFDIEAVRKQLHIELIYVDCAYTWFGNNKAVLNSLFPVDEATVTLVLQYIGVSPDNGVKVLLDIASVLAAIVGAIVAASYAVAVVLSGGTLAPAAIPVIAAITALVALSLRLGSTYAGNGGSKALELEVRQVRQTLLDNWMSAPLANDHLLEVFLQHWGFLRLLGEKMTALQQLWQPTLTDQMVAQGRREYEIGVWQTLTPSIWWVVGYLQGFHQDWNPKYGLLVADRWLLISTGREAIHYTNVPDETLERLLGTPLGTPDGTATGPLGVPINDVIFARNGWKLNYDPGFGVPFPPPQESPWLLLRSHVNPSPRRLT
jgi:hypothetical protein